MILKDADTIYIELENIAKLWVIWTSKIQLLVSFHGARSYYTSN